MSGSLVASITTSYLSPGEVARLSTSNGSIGYPSDAITVNLWPIIYQIIKAITQNCSLVKFNEKNRVRTVIPNWQTCEPTSRIRNRCLLPL